MAQRTPPSWLQYGSHPAENDRLGQVGIIGSVSGVLGAASYAVTATGSSMVLTVASGQAVVAGASTATQGSYVAVNDAATTFTVSTADATNPRIDIIYLQVNDSAYSGATNSVTLSYLAGVPAVSPVAPTPTGSATYYVLAQIAVAANATTISQSNVTDLRAPAQSPLVQGAQQTLHLNANGTALATGSSLFGLTTRPYLLAGRTYAIDFCMPFTKTTNGIVYPQFASSTASVLNGGVTQVDSAGTVTGAVSVAATNGGATTSSTFTTATNYVITVKGQFTPSSTTRLGVNIQTGAGTVTPLIGTYLTVTDLGTATAIGYIG